MAKTLYDLIGVPRNATKQDIEAACALRARRYATGESGESETYKKFWLAEIEKARTVLTDDKARGEYDASLPPMNVAGATAVHTPPAPAPDVGQDAPKQREPLFTLGDRRNQLIVVASALAGIVVLALGGAYFATQSKSTAAISKSRRAPAADPLEQAALTALAKLHAKTAIGVTYREFGQELGEANFHVKAYLDSPQPRSNPKLTTTISAAFETYRKALGVWQLRIEFGDIDVIYAPGDTTELWNRGGGYLVLPKIAKIVPNFDEYAHDSEWRDRPVRRLSAERLVRDLITEAGAAVELAQQVAIAVQQLK